MFNLKMVVAALVVANLPPLGLTMLKVHVDLDAQTRTEAKASAILAEASESLPEGEVAVVLGCYTKYCKLAKGQAKVLTPRGVEKWQIEHGKPASPSVVKSGFKVVRCHCDQPECLVRKDGIIWLETRTIKGFTVLNVTW